MMASSLIPTAASTASALVKSAAGAAAKSAVVYTSGGGSQYFEPRQIYEASEHTTRSYYLGHHHAALSRMRQMLSHVGLIIECRDFRVPLTSYNPLLEQLLASTPLTSAGSPERSRIIVYTKRDLGPPAGADGVDRIARTLAEFHAARDRAAAVVFLGSQSDQHRQHHRHHQHHRSSHHQQNPGARGDRDLLDAVKRVARAHDSLTGLRAMVVGMPNVGKSTLLNRLRARGMGLPKAARTGSQPGITRKLGTPVRITPGEDDAHSSSGSSRSSGGGDDNAGLGEGVFVVDTPGVFVPYVRDAEDMLKLALVGCVKDGLVPLVSVADYLLYRLNLASATRAWESSDGGAAAGVGVGVGVVPPDYAMRFCGGRATNDVHEFLAGVARRTGKLTRGGVPSLNAAAAWVISEFRRGAMGRFVLDDVTPVALTRTVGVAREPPLSLSQARKREKEARKTRNEAKRLGRLGIA